MNNKKLNIVWLCYFTNSEIQKFIKPRKPVNEIAPWIGDLIRLFKEEGNIELHVISQHDEIVWEKSFANDHINYHFIRKGVPLIGCRWPKFFRYDLWRDHYYFKKRVAKIVDKINPDLIHLHGAENEFCCAINQFREKYPVFITIQGFINHSLNLSSKSARLRCTNEIEIMKNFINFGYRTETMGNDIKAINPGAVLHWHNYPIKKIEPLNVEKKFDIVFFARLSKDKGIFDLLQAVSIIKKKKEDISLCIIGDGKTDVIKKLILSLGLEKNVFIAGFLPTQKDVHRLASSAKVSVLPTYHDIISGTIIESLFLKLPVVSYNVGSIHEINRKDYIISLCEKGNVEQIAEKILTLLADSEMRRHISLLGYARALEMFGESDDIIRKSILEAYEKTIRTFYADSRG